MWFYTALVKAKNIFTTEVTEYTEEVMLKAGLESYLAIYYVFSV
jgi:hypothetical protein